MELATNLEKPSKVNNAANRFTAVLFIVYLIALYWILLLKLGVQFSYMAERRVNLLPFQHTAFLTGENILNLVIFIPLGIYTAVLFKSWGFGKKLLFCFLFSLLVEGLQYILRIGAFDSTDIITNSFGGVLGLLLFFVIEKAFNNRVKAQKFINGIGAAGTFVMIVLLLLLKMNLLPIRYQ